MPVGAPISTDPRDRAIAAEQSYVSTLYQRLDALQDALADRLAELYRQRGGTHQAIWERDAFVARDVERLERLRAVERGLCFGRLDFATERARYIGRVGLSDENYETLLVDWRAPAAEPFYRATAAAPGDVVRRRHIQTRQRRVLTVEDEVFSTDGATLDADQTSTLRGEAALLASLNARRTGRMSDIVATIQAEQDRIIRSDARGVLVVQGAPGTGKTVAALHRAAYLLYTHRDRLADNGVLVIGPNRTFLRYIDQVLPSLGETGVVLATLAELYPSGSPTTEDDDVTAAAKGAAAMAETIAAAVKAQQRVPRREVTLRVGNDELALTPEDARNARTKARRSRRPHNEARHVFRRELLSALARQQGRRLGDVVDDDDLAELRDDLAGEPAVAAALDEFWPVLSPEALLTALYADADPGDPMYRVDGEWSSADIPLLDEAAELLGEVPDEAALQAAREAAAERRAEAEYARDLLGGLDLGIPVDAEQVAQRYRGSSAAATVAERAARTRDWAYGHVIVDEAQELSPMAWRMVMRRVPSRSMTIVGDIAQTAAADGARSWATVLEPLVPGRWRVETLTVNYRTPAEVMAVGAEVLASIDPSLEPPRSVRSTGTQPWLQRIGSDDLPDALPAIVEAELAAVGDGRVAVIAASSTAADEVRMALAKALPTGSVGGDDPSSLDAAVSVLTVREAKGLEFDAVVVVDPDAILAGSARGATDLYVAVTRPTQRLGVVVTGAAPEVLGRLAPRPLAG